MADAGVIDRYLADLDRRLRGPGPVKGDLLAEARDSLADAAEAYRAGGVPEAEAQRLAVAEFGPAHVIARDYQSVLALAQGSRTLRAMLFAVPLMYSIWGLNQVFWIGEWPPLPGGVMPDWYRVIAHINDRIGWIAAATALLTLVASRYLARRGTSTEALGRLTGSVSVGMVGLALFCNVSIMVATLHLDPERMMSSPPMTSASLVSLLVLGRLMVLARRCFSFASG
ncbi:permease prefix domain 1-containing protein [Saccharothrix violaceirubra]|uniref:Uncharacterized protein n=1 Tax=Saccharothrix violaceirubra TaxID=413306 RepID=A0A7W7T893_9PSEU|nr:permease prefix domain 1-containing protein [Saccharothrix violaceirubra]MBB4968407.1 hypothetical protein [Saccharothrix violaceirubra]